MKEAQIYLTSVCILTSYELLFCKISVCYRNGTLDILIADTPILDYYRATDQGCKLQRMGDAINEDMYGIGMVKGFPLKVITSLHANFIFICT